MNSETLLSPAEAKTLLEKHGQDPDFVVLDVRTPAEFAQGHLPGAVLLDFKNENFTAEVRALDRHKTYLLVCQMGGRSEAARKIMAGLGFSRLHLLEKGLNNWLAHDFPLISG